MITSIGPGLLISIAYLDPGNSKFIIYLWKLEIIFRWHFLYCQKKNSRKYKNFYMQYEKNSKHFLIRIQFF